MQVRYPCRPTNAAHPSLSVQFAVQEQLLYRNVQRFRGGLVFKAHRLLYRSILGLRVIKKKTKKNTRPVFIRPVPVAPPSFSQRRERPCSGLGWLICCKFARQRPYRATSLTRNTPPIGPYSSPMPRVLGGWAFSYGRGTPVSVPSWHDSGPNPPSP